DRRKRVALLAEHRLPQPLLLYLRIDSAPEQLEPVARLVARLLEGELAIGAKGTPCRIVAAGEALPKDERQLAAQRPAAEARHDRVHDHRAVVATALARLRQQGAQQPVVQNSSHRFPSWQRPGNTFRRIRMLPDATRGYALRGR